MATRFTVPEYRMAYRERRAWIAAITMVVAYGAYFVLVPAPRPGAPGMDILRLGWFAAAGIARAALYGGILGAIAWRTPRAERHRPDERDRAIDRRAASAAYYLLMAEMILVGIVLPFGSAGWDIVDAALLALVLAEVMRQAAIIACYRRGWHG